MISPQGWQLQNFLKNPFILWAHRYDELPIGIAEKVEQRIDGLFVSGRFASQEANPKAVQVKKLYEEGIYRAVSVGLIPLKRNGNVITEAELLEVSYVYPDCGYLMLLWASSFDNMPYIEVVASFFSLTETMLYNH